MKRVNYDGHSLVTGKAAAQALVRYAESAARMGGSATVHLPTLKENGDIADHTLLLTASTALETFDIDGDDPDDDEADRFPIPEAPAIGGEARAISEDEITDIAAPIPD